MQLTDNEVQILDFLFTGGVYRLNVTKEVIQTDFHVSDKEAEFLINDLLNKKLIEKSAAFKYYMITGAGIQAMKQAHSDHRKQIVWSIYVPIGVAAITAVVTSLITVLVKLASLGLK